MAQKSIDIFEQLEIDSGQKQKLRELDKKQIEIEESDRQALSQYESTLQDMLSGNKAVDVKELSKLDQGIERGKKFKGEITDLAQSLYLELNDLGQFFGSTCQYQGLEKWVSKISTRSADKMVRKRIDNADVNLQLQTILDYGNFMVQKLYGATVENLEKTKRIDATVKITTTKLKENQPLYEQRLAEKEGLERQVKDLQDKMDAATGTEYAQLAEKKAALDSQFAEAQKKTNYYFAIVDTAKQALPIQKTHLKAYQDIVDSLIQFKTRLEENINHVTELYLATPTAIKTALSMKAASQYDKGMKFATDKSTQAVLASAAGILDETAQRAERPLIEADKLAAYREAQKRMRADYDTRIAALEKKYDSPEAAAPVPSAN
ncbi:Uncharacterised protein [uncultured archaeon]|nr:Uncharacterised protein [uncultured archaeon]